MKSLKNAFWLVTVAGAVFVVAWFTFPDKKNRLEFIDEKISIPINIINTPLISHN